MLPTCPSSIFEWACEEEKIQPNFWEGEYTNIMGPAERHISSRTTPSGPMYTFLLWRAICHQGRNLHLRNCDLCETLHSSPKSVLYAEFYNSLTYYFHLQILRCHFVIGLDFFPLNLSTVKKGSSNMTLWPRTILTSELYIAVNTHNSYQFNVNTKATIRLIKQIIVIYELDLKNNRRRHRYNH